MLKKIEKGEGVMRKGRGKERISVSSNPFYKNIDEREKTIMIMRKEEEQLKEKKRVVYIQKAIKYTCPNTLLTEYLRIPWTLYRNELLPS